MRTLIVTQNQRDADTLRESLGYPLNVDVVAVGTPLTGHVYDTIVVGSFSPQREDEWSLSRYHDEQLLTRLAGPGKSRIIYL